LLVRTRDAIGTARGGDQVSASDKDGANSKDPPGWICWPALSIFFMRRRWWSLAESA
jgi:hypothetical protein